MGGRGHDAAPRVLALADGAPEEVVQQQARQLGVALERRLDVAQEHAVKRKNERPPNGPCLFSKTS